MQLGIVPVEEEQREGADDEEKEDPDSKHGVVLHCLQIQYDKSIYNAPMVNRRAESVAQAVTRGKDGEVWV